MGPTAQGTDSGAKTRPSRRGDLSYSMSSTGEEELGSPGLPAGGGGRCRASRGRRDREGPALGSLAYRAKRRGIVRGDSVGTFPTRVRSTASH